MAPDQKEELKDLENANPDGLIPLAAAAVDPSANQLNLMYGFLNEYQEFAWDPENSSREVTFSPDCRHLFLCESNYYFRTVVGNRPFMDGVHYWEIIADSRTEHELKIGVTTQQKFNVNSSFSDYEFGYAYYGLGQIRHSSNAVGKNYGK